MVNLPDDPRDYYLAGGVSLQQVTKAYRGRKGCGFTSLRERSAVEDWPRLKRELRIKTGQKAVEIISDQQAVAAAKSLTQLNDEHLKLIDECLGIGQDLLAQYVVTDPASGRKKVVCQSNQYRAVVQTVIDLIKVQREVCGMIPTPIATDQPKKVIEGVLLSGI